jgi:hypothetical protein
MVHKINLRLRLSPLTEGMFRVITYRLSAFLTGPDMRVNKNVREEKHEFRFTANTL